MPMIKTDAPTRDNVPLAGDSLETALERCAELLPAQGPIGIFIHHNTLHAFESMDFEDAVVSAGRIFGCEAFLPEAEYRRELEAGRIEDRDLEWALRNRLGDDAAQPLPGGLTRMELRRRILRYGLPEAEGPSLGWLLHETSALRRWREDLPAEARTRLGGDRGVRPLWDACLEACRRTPASSSAQAAERPPIRHRDLLRDAMGVDIDAWVHPLLIRLTGAFLDQGLARWSLPARSRGLYACFLDLYSRDWAALIGDWTHSLPERAREERSLELASIDSLRRSLIALGVEESEWSDYLQATALALRGWAGMVRQLERRPDRVPAQSLPARLADFLAVRLLLERLALEHAVSTKGLEGPLSSLRERIRGQRRESQVRSELVRAWRFFHVAQLAGIGASAMENLTAADLGVFEGELAQFESVERRRVFQTAFDRHLRARVCDAMVAHRPLASPAPPDFQALFCLDDREESFRRHLEEIAPECETFATAGFYGIAMYYQGATDAHPRPLCPIAIQPVHFVGEEKIDPTAAAVRWRRLRRLSSGRVGRWLHDLGGTFLGGWLFATMLGPVSLLPLMLRVVFPGLARRFTWDLPFMRAPATRLLVDRRDETPPIGRNFGYTKEEMAAIVGGVLRSMGAANRLAPLVAVLGHGSSSLNNPHGSAYDCGACGGGRGGPNGRAFAQMANDPAVRSILTRDGLRIPEGTWFVGGMRNTSDNSVSFYDLDLLPETHRPLFDRAALAIARARRKEAHERCRRFKSFPLSGGFREALAHVQARAHDLAQPRPECGHATNAYCIVGRRGRTRGLFLDRRAFLVSYDPTLDDDGELLRRLLEAVVPVVSGISLEYYFSRVDPTGYGCATKLPHNVASLLGVMDGAQSDLRTGLPWQMVEIHEPVRLFIVVECSRKRFDETLEALPNFRRLLDRRWVFAACLDPGSSSLWTREATGWSAWTPEEPLTVFAGNSTAWYGGKREHLPIAALVPVHAQSRAR